MFRLKQPSAGLTSPTKPDLLGDRSPRVFSAFAIFLAVVVAGCGGSGEEEALLQRARWRQPV